MSRMQRDADAPSGSQRRFGRDAMAQTPRVLEEKTEMELQRLSVALDQHASRVLELEMEKDRAEEAVRSRNPHLCLIAPLLPFSSHCSFVAIFITFSLH